MLKQRKERKQVTCLWAPHGGAVCSIRVFKPPVIKGCLQFQAAFCRLATEAVRHFGVLGRCTMVPGVPHLTWGLGRGRNGIIFTVGQILRIIQLAGSIQI